MAAVHQVQVSGVNSAMKEMVAAALWSWIDANGEREVWKFSFKVGPFPISKTFRFKDLHPVFVQLLGPKPSSM